FLVPGTKLCYRKDVARYPHTLRVLLLLALPACTGSSQDDSNLAQGPDTLDAALMDDAAGEPEEVQVPREAAHYGPAIRGLRLRRSIVVRAEPHSGGAKLGTVAAHTVVAWTSAAKGEGCESRWIEIAPRGWVCESYLEPVE